MLSRRTAWDLGGNRLAGALDEARAAGRVVADLATWDPATAGLGAPADALALALALAAPAAAPARGDPGPRGLAAARDAVAAWLGARGADVAPDRVVLTASTSEAYGFLLKLLCDPGDEVLAPAPGYPLLDLLAGLEAVRVVRYPLRYDGEWHVDRGALAAAIGPRTRAVVAVSPANPTGAVLSGDDVAWLDGRCAERDLALVGDEVFADCATAPWTSVLAARRALAFHLGGASKTCGLPQLKAAWIAAAGPAPLVAAALERLDVVADAALSVSGPAQRALPALLAGRERFLAPLRERLAANRGTLAQAARGAPFDLLASGGGWSAVLRTAESLDEEALALALLGDGVAVHPGFFYDFERRGHLVVSLLTPPSTFAEGARRIARRLHDR